MAPSISDTMYYCLWIYFGMNAVVVLAGSFITINEPETERKKIFRGLGIFYLIWTTIEGCILFGAWATTWLK